MQQAINFILFQAGWFACVICVARQMEWLALLSIISVIMIHLILVEDRVPDIFLIVIAGVIGFLLDSSLIRLGVFVPVNNSGFAGFAPLWLVGLWMLFAITINHSLRWLYQRYLLAALAGFVFAPIAYFAGQKLGALSFPSGQSLIISLLTIAACWLVVTPLLILSAKYINAREFHRTISG